MTAILSGTDSEFGRENSFDTELPSRYCARRLRRLRKKLGLSNAKGKNVVHRDIDVTAEHVLISALMAERAWAHAMEPKVRTPQNMGANIGDQHLRTSAGRRRSRRWLSKAVVHGTATRALCINMGDDILMRETSAYSGWLAGLYSETRGDFGHAVMTLQDSSTTYTSLARELASQQDIFLQCAVDCQRAMQRCTVASGSYCLPKTNHHPGVMMDKPAGETSIGIHLIYWCGLSLKVTGKVQQRLLACNIEGEPDARSVIAAQSGGAVGLCCRSSNDVPAPNTSFNELQYSRKLQQFEELLRVVACAESGLEPYGEAASWEHGMKSTRSPELVKARVSYEKLDILFQRCNAAVMDHASTWRNSALKAAVQLVHHESCKSNVCHVPDEIVYLYENLIQVTLDMARLEGVRDGNNEALAEALDARAAALRAYKCHYLGETSIMRPADAFALFHHASYLSDRALQEAEACEVPQLSQEAIHLSDASFASISRLKAIRALALTCKKRNNHHSFHNICFTTTLLNFLDAHPVFDQHAIAPLAMTLQRPSPVPCKPVLFNLAHNQLQLPTFQQMRKHAADKASLGLFGWFRS